MSWQTVYVPDLDSVHVAPSPDVIDHLLTADCSCIPACEPMERTDGTVGWLYVHNSGDGRD